MVRGVGRVGSAGSLKVKGSLDTSSLESGFRRVKGGFEGVRGQASGLAGSFKNAFVESQGLLNTLKGLSLAGVAGIVAIASRAPAVAPAIAKMKATFDILTRALGEALAPAFERVSVWLLRFTDWVLANKGPIRNFAMGVLDLAESIGGALLPYVKSFGEWVLSHPKLFATFFGGLALTPKILAGISTLTSFFSLVGGLGLTSGATIAVTATGLGSLGAVENSYRGAQREREAINARPGHAPRTYNTSGASTEELLNLLDQEIAQGKALIARNKQDNARYSWLNVSDMLFGG